jgi:hypothetical protein
MEEFLRDLNERFHHPGLQKLELTIWQQFLSFIIQPQPGKADQQFHFKTF